jgi:hypothetical protein
MDNERQFGRRDLLKYGGAVGAGAILGAIGSRVVKNSNDEDSVIPAEPAEKVEFGPKEEIEYEEVSPVTYFESGGAVQEVLGANAGWLSFEKTNGHLRIVSAQGEQIASLPEGQEIVGVFVSTDDFSIRFEYRRKDGSTFGITAGKSLRKNEPQYRSWDTRG